MKVAEECQKHEAEVLQQVSSNLFECWKVLGPVMGISNCKSVCQSGRHNWYAT